MITEGGEPLKVVYSTSIVPAWYSSIVPDHPTIRDIWPRRPEDFKFPEQDDKEIASAAAFAWDTQ
jgi:hypothetical protein